MKVGLITLILLVLGVSLSGCGQKGPLYREAPGQNSAETEAESEREASRQNPDDG